MKHSPLWILFLLAFHSTVVSGQVIMDRASTAGESYARGASDMIRSRGEANLSNSQAAINAQDAYSMSIDNSIKSVNAYWERRDTYNQHRAEQMYEITSRRERRMARTGLKSLTPQEFDRTSGHIEWPGALKQAQYDEYRQPFDTLFQKRAQEGWLGSDDYMALASASKEWRDVLQNQKDEYPRNVLSQMIRFVLKLDRELNQNLS